MSRLVLSTALLLASTAPVHAEDRPRDLSKDKTLYCVGYAHLDTQWRWDFTTTIDKFLRATLEENFERFEKHPGYVFNFTGSARYHLMKEYYPEQYERLKQYIAAGRWFVSGSSVDEGDVNVPSAEAVLRQVLYGNEYFRREFGKESVDYMLPDCFGFPASMPSIWAHAGLKGFSTQKADVGIGGRHSVHARHVDRAGWTLGDGGARSGLLRQRDPGPRRSESEVGRARRAQRPGLRRLRRLPLLRRRRPRRSAQGRGRRQLPRQHRPAGQQVPRGALVVGPDLSRSHRRAGGAAAAVQGRHAADRAFGGDADQPVLR
jgi:hypothetical protein